MLLQQVRHLYDTRVLGMSFFVTVKVIAQTFSNFLIFNWVLIFCDLFYKDLYYFEDLIQE